MQNKIGELAVDLKLNIDQRTAVAALHIVELYINLMGYDVLVTKERDGSISLEYVARDD